MLGAAQEGFEGGVVFLRGGAVGAGAVGEERGGIFEGFAEQRAAEEDVAGGHVAGQHGRCLAAGSVGGGRDVVLAVGDGGAGVVEGCGAGEEDGELAQGVVDFEHFGAVDRDGVLAR